MASNSEPGRSPSKDCGEEERIAYNLEVFKNYFINDLDPNDFLMAYKPLPPDERRRLYKHLKGIASPAEKWHEIFDTIARMKTVEGRYIQFVEALEVEEYTKIAEILRGNLTPMNDDNRKQLDKHLKILCDNMELQQLLWMFKRADLISQKDYQTLNALCNNEGNSRATCQFLLILPAKHKDWYVRFLKVLVENNHKQLAQEVDEDMVERIMRSKETEDSMSGTASCVSSLPANKRKELCKMALNKCHTAFLKDMHPPTVLDVIIQNELLPELLIRDISEKPTTTDKNRCIIQEMKKRSVEDYQTFKSGLRDANHGHLADSLEEAELMSLSEIQQAGTSSGGNEGSMDVRENVMYAQRDPSMDDFDDGPRSGWTDLSLISRFQSLTLGQDDTPKMDLLEEPKLNLKIPSDDLEKQDEEQKNSDVTGTSSQDSAGEKDTSKIQSKFTEETQSKPVEGATDLSKFQRLTIAKPVGTKEKEQSSVEKAPPSQFLTHTTTESCIEETQPKSLDSSMNSRSMEEDVDISLRDYQMELASEALAGKNVIIVAPTGSGKTRVALRIIQEHMRLMKGKGIPKVIFLVNQVALANQQGEECKKMLRNYTCEVISGDTQRSKNVCLKDFMDKRDILVVTAQVLLDSLVNRDIKSVSMFSLMIFDECHHTHANHTFNQIMSMYMELKLEENPPALPQIVGLTASVGVGKARNVEKAVEHIKKLMANLDAAKISTVMSNLAELRQHVSLPEEETCTVQKRQNDLFGEEVVKIMNRIEVRMSNAPMLKDMAQATQFENALKAPADKGNVQYTQWVSKLWKEIAKIRSEETRRYLNPCRTLLEYYNNALIIYNDARTKDGLTYLNNEMKRWRESSIMSDIEKELDADYEALKKLDLDGCSLNPKLEMLREMIRKAYDGAAMENSRGIIFVKTRDLAQAIVSWMKETPGIKELNPITFLGQNAPSEGGGMTKGEQDNALKYFKSGKHKLIVATSVAEEGLDISKCNLVIRYDHVTNEIAMVQSRGRGRAQDSKYFVLAEEGTGVAEKEELNMIREVMMRHAIKKLQEEIYRSPQKVQKEVEKFQNESNINKKLKSLAKTRRIIRSGEFELRCYTCNTFICMSSDIKRIQNAHHVVVDESLPERVNFIEGGSTKHIDDTIQFTGKLMCMDCGANLGVICIHNSLQFPVIKIEKFLIVDSNGRQDTCKKWNKVPFSVRPLTINDFQEIYQRRKQDQE